MSKRHKSRKVKLNDLPIDLLYHIGILTESPVDYGSLAKLNKSFSRLLNHGDWYRKKAINHFTTLIVDKYGDKYWYRNGDLYKIDRRLDEDDYGGKYWYRNGQRHRINGPAIEYANGDKEWWVHGKRHREDGPATCT